MSFSSINSITTLSAHSKLPIGEIPAAAENQYPPASLEKKNEEPLKNEGQTVTLTLTLVKLESEAIELGNNLTNILTELAENLVDDLLTNQTDRYLNSIKKLSEEFIVISKQRKKIEKDLVDKLDPKNPYLDNWNNLQFHLYKISTILEWLKNFYNLPSAVYNFWESAITLLTKVERLKKMHHANISSTEILEIKEQFKELKNYLSANPQIRQTMLKLWEKNFYPSSISFYLTEDGRQTKIYSEVEALKKEIEAYSDSLYGQCLEKWNEALFQLLKIETFLETIDFLCFQFDPVKSLLEKIETLNQNARQSLNEMCEQNKKTTPIMSHLRERLKRLDNSLIYLLEEKKLILNRYKQFILSSQEVYNVNTERLIYSHLKNFVFNVNNSVESITILIRNECEEFNSFREQKLKELKELWAAIREKLPNTGRQLDKFVDAYGNRGLPFVSFITGNSYAVSENYKNMCLQDDPLIRENRINVFLGLEK